MVRQSCGGCYLFNNVTYCSLVLLLHLDMNSSIDMVSTGPALPETFLVIFNAMYLLRTSTCIVKSDLVWLMNNMATTVIEHYLRRVVCV